jgi:hypothetical protein
MSERFEWAKTVFLKAVSCVSFKIPLYLIIDLNSSNLTLSGSTRHLGEHRKLYLPLPLHALWIFSVLAANALAPRIEHWKLRWNRT